MRIQSNFKLADIQLRTLLLFIPIFFLRIQEALAHHPWEGRALSEWHQGFLSGLAHPVLGFDHLAFLAAVAILCAVFFGDKKTLLAFIPATIAGVFIYLLAGWEFELRFYETAVSLTVAVAGVFIFQGSLSAKAALFFCALFGLFHGYAYGGGIVGAETSPLVFYLAGLTFVQTALVLTMSFFIIKFLRVVTQQSSKSRLSASRFSKVAGVFLFTVGAVMSVQSAITLF